MITDMRNAEIFELAMPRLCLKLGNWHCAVLMWRKCKKPSQRTKTVSTRSSTTPCQFQVTSSIRTSPMVPNMELPNGNECTTKPRRCCRKPAVTKPFWEDGTRMTNTASLCQMLGGLVNRLFSMTNLHWMTSLVAIKE